MNVLIVAPSCGKDNSFSGGAPEMVRRIETELIKRNIVVRTAKGGSPFFILKIWQNIQHADIVYLSPIYSFCVPITLAVAKIQLKPLILAPHGSLQRWKGTTKPRIKRVWENVCRMISPQNMKIHTTCEQETIESRRVFPNAKYITIPNGVDIPRKEQNIRSRSSKTRLLFIGRIHPKKGIENLLFACSMLKSESFDLTIAGRGNLKYEKTIQNLINQLHLENTVHMIGHVQGIERERVWSKSDITVVPSHTENFANVVAESLARGVPVIASTKTPWKGLEEHNCGMWISNEPEFLARAIMKMKKNNLPKMGINGQKWMKQHFSWDIHMQMLIPEMEFSKSV